MYGAQSQNAISNIGVLSHARSEFLGTSTKPSVKEYWYVDFRRAVDATKYRIHRIDEWVKAESKPTTEKKEFSCKRCGSQWTTIEVLDYQDPEHRGSGFLCKKCGEVLDYHTEEDDADQPQVGDMPAQFNKQFKRLLDTLQKIDSSRVPIPAVTGEQAYEDRREIPRDEITNPATKSVAAESRVKLSDVKGIRPTAEKFDVTLTTDSETNAQEAAAKAAERQKIAQQNQMPVWMAASTVQGAQKDLTAKANGTMADGDGVQIKGAAGEDPDNKTVNPALDDYFEKLRKEQEEEAARKAAGLDQEDSSDEAEDFEDVILPSAAPPVTDRVASVSNGTTATSSATAKSDANGSQGSNVKRERSEDGNLASNGKRIKIEVESPGEGGSKAAPAPAADDEESDEDEFIDV